MFIDKLERMINGARLLVWEIIFNFQDNSKLILSLKLLLASLEFYIRLDNNKLLSSHPFACILLHTNFLLIIFFPNFLSDVYLIYSIKLVIIVKKIMLNRKQIGIILGFVYTKYKVQGTTFKFTVLDM